MLISEQPLTLEHSLQELILEKKGMERVAEAVHQGKMVVAMDDMGWRLEFANDVAASLAGRESKWQTPLVCCSGRFSMTPLGRQ